MLGCRNPKDQKNSQNTYCRWVMKKINSPKMVSMKKEMREIGARGDWKYLNAETRRGWNGS